MPTARTTHAAVVGVPVVVSAGLGSWDVTRHDSMWRDESVTYQVAHRSLGQTWHLLGHIDAVHGLYYLLMHAVFAVWDGGLVALRLPSVVAMAVAAGFTAAIGRRFLGPRGGLLAGLAFAVLPVVQKYAQEGRSYAIVAALVAASTWTFLRAAEDGRVRWWAAYGLVSLAACWFNEFAALAVLSHGVAMLRDDAGHGGADRAVWRRYLVAGGLVLAGVLPLVVISSGQSGAQLGWLGRPHPIDVAEFLAIGLVLVLVARFCPAGRFGPVQLSRLSLALWFVPAGLLMLSSFTVKRVYIERYVAYSSVAFALMIALALERAIALVEARFASRAARVRIAAAAVAVVLAVLAPWAVLVRSPQSRKDDVVAVSDDVRSLARPGEAVLFAPSRRREWLMSYPDLRANLDDIALRADPAVSGTLEGDELPAAQIARRMRAQTRIIVLEDRAGQPLDKNARERAKREVLARYFTPCFTLLPRGGRVVVYVKRGQTCGI